MVTSFNRDVNSFACSVFTAFKDIKSLKTVQNICLESTAFVNDVPQVTQNNKTAGQEKSGCDFNA